MRFLQAARRRPGRVTRSHRRVAQRHDRRTAPLAPISDGSGCDGEAPRELVEEAVEGVRYFTGDLIGHCKGHHQLCARLVPGPDDEQVERRHALADPAGGAGGVPRERPTGAEIGRASCRERGCQYVLISVVAGTFKTQNTNVISNTIYNTQTSSAYL